VLYRARPEIVANAAELQPQLLARASEWLDAGGALVYSVCSLEPQEGEDVVSAFLQSHPDFSIKPPAPGELPPFASPSAQGWIRILPGILEAEGGLDGFFMARLVRRAG
jgi:16S rRNA (cytosine967-C5)-methyltransferase